jgi:monoamine oxidase
VVIVGAGLCGLNCAYQLKKAGVRATVYEGSARVGGRLKTLRNAFGQSANIELGGEFIDTEQTQVWALAREFGLGRVNRSDDSPDIDPVSWLYDGRLRTHEEIIDAFRAMLPALDAVLAEAENDEDAAYEKYNAMSLQQWLDSVRAPSLAAKVLITLMVTEYGLDAEELNSLLLIGDLAELGEIDPEEAPYLFDLGDTWFLADGNDALTRELAARLDGQIEMGARLVAVAPTAGGRYTLTFERDRGRFDVTADHVVLTIPYPVLRDVDLRVDLPEDMQTVLEELAYGQNSKLIGGFTRRVWREDQEAMGSIASDSRLQAIYDPTRAQGRATGALLHFLGGAVSVEAPRQYPTAEAHMRANLELIEQVFPGATAAWSGQAVRQHWPSEPLQKGSYIAYGVGQLDYEGVLGGQIGNLHITGGDLSLDWDGMIEGAAETGAAAASAVLAALGRGAAGQALTLASRKGGRNAFPFSRGQRRRRLEDLMKRKSFSRAKEKSKQKKRRRGK